jgi:hypothetical protein
VCKTDDIGHEIDNFLQDSPLPAFSSSQRYQSWLVSAKIMQNRLVFGIRL